MTNQSNIAPDFRSTTDAKGKRWFLLRDVCEYKGMKAEPHEGYGKWLRDIKPEDVSTGKKLNVFTPGVASNARWVRTEAANKILAAKVVQPVKAVAKKETVKPVANKQQPVENNATVTVQDFCKVSGLELSLEQKVLLGMKARKISRANGRDITAKGVVRLAACVRKGKTYYANKIVPAHNVMSLTEAAKEIGVLK